MDLLTREENENWTALLAAVVSAFLLASAVGFILDRDTQKKEDRKRRITRTRVEPDEPGVPQARWRLRAFASSAPGDPTAKQTKAVKRVMQPVKDTVRDLYDALTISRGQLKKISDRLMTPTARRALRGRPLAPFPLKGIRTVKREGKITIDLHTRKLASADVNVVFKAQRGNKRFRFAHDGTLWLERGPSRWRVIAFTFDRRKVG